MAIHIDLMANEAGRQAAQIASLAAAAACVFGGGAPADPLVRDNILLNLLDVIEVLAGHAEGTMELIERETAKAA